jgi:two-component sensor histidine kinase
MKPGKALLMREMAHRVKNDLALISSAISLQARTSENEEVREALEAANARVHVIAAAQALSRPGDGGAVGRSASGFTAPILCFLARPPPRSDSL